jgi:uncharacterized protein YbaR (Trm112 family)
MQLDETMLHCPVTQSQLARREDRSLISPEGRVYRTIGSVPILVDPDSSVFDVDAIGPPSRHTDGPRLRRLVTSLVPSPTRALGSHERFERLVALVKQQSQRPRVLVIGGGTLGNGTEALVDGAGLTVVETDVYIGPRTAVVCDAHQLPFADRMFDA